MKDNQDSKEKLRKFRRLLTAFKKDSDTWNELRKKVEKIYMGKPVKGVRGQTYNTLWSNVQVLVATCFSRIPKVVSERRFKDRDPVGLLAAKLEERATSFSLSAEENEFYYAVNDSVRDRFLGGLGVAWVRYEPYFDEVVDEATQSVKLDENGSPVQKVTFEEAVTDHILPQDFGWNSNAREPREIRQIWKKVRMSKSKLSEQFGREVAEKVPLDDFDEQRWSDRSEAQDIEPRACIIELWDKESKCVYWFTEGSMDEPLRVLPDPLRLKHFFPIPRPLFATLCGQDLFPTPDYIIYEELAVQLNDINTRLGHLTQMVRLTGIHSAEINENLDKLRSAVDGTTIPVAGWTNVQGGGGLAGMMEWLPITEVAGAIQQLEARAEALTQRIYEVTGLSDIVRGTSNPYETKGAQEIKNQWASIRVTDKQHDVQRFIKDLLELKAEILCKHFSDESWALITGYASLTPEEQALFPEALALLRNDDMRTFRITLETDSTIEVNENKEKEAAMEFVNSLANLFAQGGQIMSLDPALKITGLQSVLMAARRFRASREIEQYLTQGIDKMIAAQQELEKNPPPPQPTPEEIEIQTKAQLETQKMDLEAQFDAQKMQLESQIAYQQQQLDQYKVQSDMQLKTWKAEQDLDLKEQKLIGQMKLQEEKLMAQLAIQEAKLKADIAIQEAKLQADVAMKQAELATNALASKEEEAKDKDGGHSENPSSIVLNIDAKQASKRIVRLGDKVGVIEDVEE